MGLDKCSIVSVIVMQNLFQCVVGAGAAWPDQRAPPPSSGLHWGLFKALGQLVESHVHTDLDCMQIASKVLNQLNSIIHDTIDGAHGHTMAALIRP